MEARVYEAGDAAVRTAGDSGRTRAWVGRVLRLGVGVGILYFLFTFIPVPEVVAALATASPRWLALSLVVLAAERYLSAVRVTILSRQAGMSLTVWRNLEISLAATFYGMFLPGELAGGAVRWYKMSRPGGRRAEAAAVLTFDRLIGTIILLIAGTAFWLLTDPPLSNPAVEWSFLILLVVLVAGMGVSLHRRALSVLLTPAGRVAERFRLRFVYNALEKLLAAVRSFRDLTPPAVALLLGVSVVRHALAVLLLYCFAAAVGIDVGFASLVWIHAFMNIALMLPVSFSGLGIREGALVFALRPYGVAGSAAIALSFIILLSHVLVAAAGGLLELKGVRAGSPEAGRAP